MRHQQTSGNLPLIDQFNQNLRSHGDSPSASRSALNAAEASNTQFDAGIYTQPFIDYISSNPTVYHAVDSVAKLLQKHGFIKLSERSVTRDLRQGGKYFVERNGSSIIAFIVGEDYKAGNGASIIASHIDALSARLKPVSKLPNRAGYTQLAVAPYAGALNSTWWDRDLGVGGRVLLRNKKTGKITSNLVKLDWPIARIPTLAPHFGQAASMDHANKETQMVPIIGVDNDDLHSQDATATASSAPAFSGSVGDFASSQPPALVKAVMSVVELPKNEAGSSKDDYMILNWDLELFDFQPATVGGLDKSLLFAGRLDDKLCSWAAVTALLRTSPSKAPNSLKIVACFDDEEIGSLLRQGAHSNFLLATLNRINDSFLPDAEVNSINLGLGSSRPAGPESLMYAGLAKSFLLSADVGHATNPNFAGSSYLPYHSPRLNVGVSVQADPNGHTTTDAISFGFLQRFAARCNPPHQLQVFQIRNDSRSGGTVGPMLSSALGCRAIDAGIGQLAMHSIRACTGSKDVGLGVQLFTEVLDGLEDVDTEFSID